MRLACTGLEGKNSCTLSVCVCPYSVSFSGPKSAGKGHWTATVTTPAPYWKVQRFSSRSTLSGHTKQKSALRRDTACSMSALRRDAACSMSALRRDAGFLHERSEKRHWVLHERSEKRHWVLHERSEKRHWVLHDDLRRDAACSMTIWEETLRAPLAWRSCVVWRRVSEQQSWKKNPTVTGSCSGR